MKPRDLLWLFAACLASGCGSTQSTRSTSALAFRGEVGGTYAPHVYHGGAVGTVSTGFAAGNVCCEIGAYLTGLGHWNDPAKRKRADTVLSAGFGLASQLTSRLGIQLRAGAAGTPPDSAMLGRRGFMGSGALVWRVTDPNPPAVSHWAPLTELALGLNWASLNPERSSAGPEPTPDSKAVNVIDFVLSLRFGASYGLDLK